MLICPAAMLTSTRVIKCGLTFRYPPSRKVVPMLAIYSILTIPVPTATPENNKCEIKDYSTPQPLYNTVLGVLANFRVSYPIRVITRVNI